MARAELAVAFDDPTCMVFTYRNVVFPVMGRPEPTVEATLAQAKAIERFAAGLGTRAVHEISLLDDEFPLPSAEVRGVLEAASPVISPFYASVACVYEGLGFRAALVRGVLATLQLVSRADFPQKVFDTPAEAARWTATHGGATGRAALDPDELTALLAEIRARATERGVLGRRLG